jgi:transposase
MDGTINQCVGIDISKSTFTACICKRNVAGQETYGDVADFTNSKQGYNQLLRWSRKHADPSLSLIFAMEATGVYYEGLAYHLFRLNQRVAVILPNKVKHFGKSINIKTKTDIVDARIIARMGVERPLDQWQPPAPIFKELRDLTRLYADLKKERTTFSNRLKAFEAGAAPLPFIINANNSIIKGIDSQLAKCEKEIKTLIYSEKWLAAKVEKILTIKGVGLITVAILVAETQGFALIKNAKQLASYAGYDIVLRESGTSVKGKTRISKKGNSRIRASLYFPVLVSARFNQDLKSCYDRININKASKMIGATALQRKILLLIYALWKKDEIFIKDYKLEPKDQSLNVAGFSGNGDAEIKVGRPIDLPTQDEHSNDESGEVLFRMIQN